MRGGIPQPRNAAQWQTGRGAPPGGYRAPAPMPAKMPPALTRPHQGYHQQPHLQPMQQMQQMHQGGAIMELQPLPYGEPRSRRVQEHRARYPHRQHVSPDLLTVVHHWVDQEVGECSGSLANVAQVELNTTDHIEGGDEIEVSGKKVNVRAFLVLGAEAEKEGLPPHLAKHIIRRISVLGTQGQPKVGAQLGGRPVHGYGGVVRQARTQGRGADNALTKELVRLVKEQSGLDLSGVKWTKLIELKYSGDDAPPNTLYFVPDLSGLMPDAQAKSLIKEEDEEYEEEVEVEVTDDEAAEEEKKEGEE